MRHKTPEFSRRRRVFCLLTLCAVALLCLSQAALAQSGRRQNKPLSPPTPVVTKDEGEAKTEVKPRADKPATLATVIVGGDRFDSSMVVSGYLTEAMEACILELNKSRALEARGGGDMTRKEAIDRAKKETEAHVLWLSLRVDGNRQDDIAVSYTLFTPQTGKVLAFGNVYLASRRMGRGPVGVGIPSTSGRMPLQYLMREAGREVAERAMGKLQTATRD